VIFYDWHHRLILVDACGVDRMEFLDDVPHYHIERLIPFPYPDNDRNKQFYQESQRG
jgi:hypothetical protein